MKPTSVRRVNRAALGLPAKRHKGTGCAVALPDIGQYIITFPGHPATVNQLLSRHWARRGALKRLDRDTIAILGKDLPRATCKRRVSLHLTMAPRQRRPDADASWKSLLDALVACGLLVDDSPKWCELTPRTEGRGKRAETMVTLEDC